MVRCVLKRLEYILKYDSHFKFSSQHNFGEGEGNSYNMTLCILNKIIVGAPKIMKKVVWPRFVFTNHLVLIARSIS